MTSDVLLSLPFVSDAVRAVVSDRAWLQALLDVEAALATAEARAGVIPPQAAEAIASACAAERFDIESLGRESRAAGNPVIPLVRALAAEVGGDFERYVHWGATSQDVMDTGAMLVCRRALDPTIADLDRIAEACAKLADEHRSTLMVGRTLLQHALPTTFGLKAASWLVAVLDARRALLEQRATLAVDLGGAAGTLASLGSRGPDVLRNLADELQLAEPVVPWHTTRARVAAIGASLAVAAGTMAKLAIDVALMAQTEVGEVSEPDGRRGGSSTMPHKRNPIGAALAIACARRAQAAAGILLGAMVQEHERAAGAWHAEWEPLRDVLALTAGATDRMREVVGGLEVHTDRMRKNLEITGGLLLAERVSLMLAARLGRIEAHELVDELCAHAVASGRSLREVLRSDPRTSKELTESDIEGALDPQTYLGSADVFVDRALGLYRNEVEGS